MSNVIIYSTQDCAACHTLEQWLVQNDVMYEKKVTDTDPALMEEFMSVNDGMIGVPFSIVTNDAGEETKISGYVPAKFKQALGL